MASKTKLELTWIGKDKRENLEPRVIVENEALSHFVSTPDGTPGLRDNILIKGDNLLALKALESKFSNEVQCVYIDPPYNTGAAFEHYNDGVEHSLWLSLMRDRLNIIRNLLRADGTIWINIDDNESHYLRVLCDEIFGRKNFIANVLWQKRTSPDARRMIGAAHDHILVYEKEYKKGALNKLPHTGDGYSNPDNDPRGVWASTDFTAQGYRPNQMYQIETPSGRVLQPPPGRCWGAIEPTFTKMKLDNRVWFGENGDARPRIKKLLSETDGKTSWTWWTNKEVGHNQEAKKESISLFGQHPFETPKPERLIERILSIATKPGDLVLDSFAGSGTTGAVAHKMGRRWVMVELGDHADTHIVPRLKKVIEGQDLGGVTKASGWQGGGGYRYFHLAPSLLEKDQWGQHVISNKYNPEMLAEAVCKLMGFTYEPSQDYFWLHGHSTENDFIYVTTQRLPYDTLRRLSNEVGDGRTLLVCCRAHDENTFDNLTVRKIPHAVIVKCEWGRDDYSLNIQEAPAEPITQSDLDEDDTEEAAE